MNVLVRHLVANNLDEIVSKSILNCHCRGVHSIMLLDAPEKRIRLYVAKGENEMYRNMYHLVTSGRIISRLHPRNDMSVGFHAHHCNITLYCIKGELHNWIVKEVPIECKGFDIVKWAYQSYITKGEMVFKKIGDSRLETVEYKIVKQGGEIVLDAKQIHTVACHPFEVTAWLVFEGKEDPDYESYIWTTSNLNNMNTDGMYIKPTKTQVLELLKLCELL